MTWEREAPYQAPPPACWVHCGEGTGSLGIHTALGDPDASQSWGGASTRGLGVDLGSQAKLRAPDPKAASCGVGGNVGV